MGTQWEERAKARNKIVQDSAKVLAMVPKLQADAARSAADWAQQQAGQAQLDRYEELLGMADGRRITPAMRRYQRAETDLAPVLAAGGAAAERARTVLRQLKPEFVQLQAVAEEFSQSFLSTIEAAATGGIKSFKAFADSVIMDLARILQRQYLAPALSELIGKGLQAGLSALGLAGGITANPTQYSAPIGPTLPGNSTRLVSGAGNTSSLACQGRLCRRTRCPGAG